jgi:thiol-disulfide isomerase/thioredoxin
MTQVKHAMRLFFLLVGLLLTFPVPAHAQAVVSGRLLGYDGDSLPVAHVALISNASRFPRPVVRQFDVAPDGTFSISLRAPAVHRLRFSGLYHSPHEWPVYVAKSDTVRVEVRLGARALATDTLDLSYTADWGASDRSWTRLLVTERDAGGRFSVIIPAQGDTVAYALRSRSGRDVGWSGGPIADRYKLTDEGNYFALIQHGGKSEVSVPLTPDAFPLRRTNPQVSLLKAPEHTRQFASVASDFERRLNAHRKRADAQRADGTSLPKTDDWSQDLQELARKRRTAQTPFLRNAWTMAYLWAGTAHRFHHDWKLNKTMAQNILEEIPPTSPLWSYVPHSAGIVIESASKTMQSQAYVEGQRVQPRRITWSNRYASYVQALTTHPDSSASVHWLQTAVKWSQEVDDFEMLSRSVGRFMEKYGDTPWGEQMRHRFRAERDLQAGRPVPDFDFPSLENSDRRITRDALLGQPYVLSFWATWCGPCRPKVKTLAKIDSAYGNDGLRILSVSMDFERNHAIEFQDQSQPMPWLNAYLKDWEPDEGVLKDFEIAAIPYGLLIDRNGRIVAIDNGSPTFLDQVVLLMEGR